MMKTCTQCGQEQPIESYHRHARTRDRRQPMCKTCAAKYRRAHYIANREKVLAQCAVYARANPHVRRASARKWRENHPDRKLAQRVRRQETKAHHFRAYASNRRAAKRNARPPWFGELDRFVLAEAAHLAALRQSATGFKWHVDHTVPLKGKTVSGLHVWNNFQVIPAITNMQKSNHFSPMAH